MDATATVIDLQPFLNAIVTIASTVLVGVGTWAIQRYMSRWLDAKSQAVLNTAILGAVSYAETLTKEAGKGSTVDVGSPEFAAAVRYVQQHVPDTLARLGVTPQSVAELVISRLPSPTRDAVVASLPDAAAPPAPAVVVEEPRLAA